MTLRATSDDSAWLHAKTLCRADRFPTLPKPSSFRDPQKRRERPPRNIGGRIGVVHDGRSRQWRDHHQAGSICGRDGRRVDALQALETPLLLSHGPHIVRWRVRLAAVSAFRRATPRCGTSLLTCSDERIIFHLPVQPCDATSRYSLTRCPYSPPPFCALVTTPARTRSLTAATKFPQVRPTHHRAQGVGQAA